jgi:hypothetical protein
MLRFIYCESIDLPADQIDEFVKVLVSFNIDFYKDCDEEEEVEEPEAALNENMSDDEDSELEIIEPYQEIIDVDDYDGDVIVKEEEIVEKETNEETRTITKNEDQIPVTIPSVEQLRDNLLKSIQNTSQIMPEMYQTPPLLAQTPSQSTRTPTIKLPENRVSAPIKITKDPHVQQQLRKKSPELSKTSPKLPQSSRTPPTKSNKSPENSPKLPETQLQLPDTLQSYLLKNPLNCPLCSRVFTLTANRNEHLNFCFENGQKLRDERTARSVYAKGFPLDSSFSTLFEFFSKNFGQVERLIMRKYYNPIVKQQANPQGSFKGSVFVVFATLEQAQSFLNMPIVKYKEKELLRYTQSKYNEIKKNERQREYERKKAIEQANSNLRTFNLPRGAIVHFSGSVQGISRDEIRKRIAEIDSSLDVAHIHFDSRVDGHLRFTKANHGKVFMEKLGSDKLSIKETEVTLKLLEGEDEEKFIDEAIKQMQKHREKRRKEEKKKPGPMKRKQNDQNGPEAKRNK